jgi:AcrR family transcriptional regulator
MTEGPLRDIILAGAANLFQARGYAAVSVRMIASEAYVTTGSLYYYFKDKDEIVREILDTGHRRVLEEVRSAVGTLGEAADKTTKIKIGIRAHLTAMFEKDSFPAANIRIFSHVPEHIKRLVRPGRRAYEKFWYQLLLSDNQDETTMVNAQHLTMFLLGAANWTLEWYRPSRDSLDDIAANLARTFALASTHADSRILPVA